jgi:prepilin-type N-terminal cleavage/methylation domain-containing protein
MTANPAFPRKPPSTGEFGQKNLHAEPECGPCPAILIGNFPMLTSASKRKSGFTLLEIMIVVAIILDIAVMAMPSFIRSRKFTQDTRFMVDLRAASDGFDMYAAEHSSYPPNAGPGVIPAGMQQYLAGMDWTGRTSIGGTWNWDNNRNGSIAAVGVLFQEGEADDVRMASIDERLDNGILTTGGFRKKTENIYAHVTE